jgi:hypothetical protein
MLMPCQSDGRPIAPADYDGWCRRSKGIDGIKIFLMEDPVFEEYDDFVYIRTKGQFQNNEFIRYDVRNDKIYIWEDGGTLCETIENFKQFCDKNKISIQIKDVIN